MSSSGVFSFLLPKKSVFFSLYYEQSTLLIKASEELVKFCKETDKEKQKELYTTIRKLESDCDGVTHKITDELNNTFITPFDREDIRELADHMDDVADFIKSAAKRAIIYQPKELHPNALEISEIILTSCVKIQKAIQGLENINKNSKETLELCKKIKEIEHKGDDSYEEFLNQCFINEKDAIEIIKQTQIMKVFEKTTNAANEVGKVIKTILIKYA
jgi:predicted phosphate transport protein (TIGR00153 family)